MTRTLLKALPLASLLLGACAQPPLRTGDVSAAVRAEIAATTPSAASTAPSPAVPPSISDSLLGDATPAATPGEPRFDLVVNGAAVRDVFLALVSDTRYSMVMHPEVTGTVSVTLRGVTVREALETIRDVYGYDFKIDGRRVTVYPPTLQTRIFTINVLNSQRSGRSDMRVSAGSAPSQNSGGTNGSSGNAAGSTQPESSHLVTSSNADFWSEITAALKLIVGNAAGRNVVTSPQAGVVAVRALPDELRQVETFLRQARVAVERQVMLEAKIVEVELRDGFQSGIDWSLLKSRLSAGTLSGYANNPQLVGGNGLPTQPNGAGQALISNGVPMPVPGNGMFGMALAGAGFQAVLGFMESYGDVQILSSPRVATLNNQKAVLKVGVDDYFVTNVTGGSTTSGSGSGNTTTLPALTLTPFFSGIALDVTPQIDEEHTVTLHVHPSVTQVSEKTKQIDLGTIGNYRLPLASSSVNETDTMVRVPDGQIVAIGGLMQAEAARSGSGLPGTTGHAIGATLLGNRLANGRKRELVVLIRPTIIRSAEDWQTLTQRSRVALDDMGATRARVITVDAATPTRTAGAAGTP